MLLVYNISKQWVTCDHKIGDSWTINLIQDNLQKQLLNADMVPSEEKDTFY